MCATQLHSPSPASRATVQACRPDTQWSGGFCFKSFTANEIHRQCLHVPVATGSVNCNSSLRIRTKEMPAVLSFNTPSPWQVFGTVNKSACSCLLSWMSFTFGISPPFGRVKAERRASKLRKTEKKLPEELNVRAEFPSTGAQEESVKDIQGALRRTETTTERQAGATPVAKKTEEIQPDSNGWIREGADKTKSSLSITILGATGDLARNKIFPALFALFNSGCLPENVGIFGFSRSKMSDEEFRSLISQKLTCRIDQREDCGEKITKFLEMVQYVPGVYEACDAMAGLVKKLKQSEGNGIGNRIFYLSVPYENVPEVARCVSAYGQSSTGWTRVILEKPFGHDVESSARITDALLAGLTEEQIYRIDQHLGKELMENLTVLRFSNLVFEPLWSRTYIRNVQVVLSEDWGVEGRGRYFNEHGIIRDIVQSNVLQTIALFAMEPPVSLDGEDIRNEKVKVLRSMRKPTLNDVVLGQYKASVSKDGKSRIPGYLDEQDVPPNSLTPTFVAGVLYIDNARWDGVPFLIKAGIGLIKHKVEIRIQFRHVPGNLYRERFGFNLDLATNELIIRIQPDEAVFLRVNNKVPGLGLQLDSQELNLFYRDIYAAEDIPDSYERLILDVIDGDNHLFIRGDECQAAWELLAPVLSEIKEQKVSPELYSFGGRGPVGAYYLAAKHGVRWADD